MDAAGTIGAYYDALRDGEPIAPFFAGVDGVVKFGISERLTGPEEVTEGLCDQARTTTDWVVESDRLRVTERGCHAWFSADVFMGWTDTERAIRHEFDTRWSGTLEARTDGDPDPDGEWRFVGMHVSTAGEL